MKDISALVETEISSEILLTCLISLHYAPLVPAEMRSKRQVNPDKNAEMCQLNSVELKMHVTVRTCKAFSGVQHLLSALIHLFLTGTTQNSCKVDDMLMLRSWK